MYVSAVHCQGRCRCHFLVAFPALEVLSPLVKDERRLVNEGPIAVIADDLCIFLPPLLLLSHCSNDEGLVASLTSLQSLRDAP